MCDKSRESKNDLKSVSYFMDAPYRVQHKRKTCTSETGSSVKNITII